MFKFVSIALVTLMVSTAAAPAFAKGDKGHHGGGKSGGAHLSACGRVRRDCKTAIATSAIRAGRPDPDRRRQGNRRFYSCWCLSIRSSRESGLC